MLEKPIINRCQFHLKTVYLLRKMGLKSSHAYIYCITLNEKIKICVV